MDVLTSKKNLFCINTVQAKICKMKEFGLFKERNDGEGFSLRKNLSKNTHSTENRETSKS